MKNLFLLTLVIISLTGCSRNACDCKEDLKDLDSQGNSYTSSGDFEGAARLIDEYNRVSEECGKFGAEDYKKCK